MGAGLWVTGAHPCPPVLPTLLRASRVRGSVCEESHGTGGALHILTPSCKPGCSRGHHVGLQQDHRHCQNLPRALGLDAAGEGQLRALAQGQGRDGSSALPGA